MKGDDLEVVRVMPSRQELNAEIVVRQILGLAIRGEWQDRDSLVYESGLGWDSYIDAMDYAVLQGLFIKREIAPVYDPKERLWTGAAERYGSSYDEAAEYIEWNGRYLSTRCRSTGQRLAAINAAFPALRLRRKTLASGRRLEFISAEVDDWVVDLREVVEKEKVKNG